MMDVYWENVDELSDLQKVFIYKKKSMLYITQEEGILSTYVVWKQTYVLMYICDYFYLICRVTSQAHIGMKQESNKY
jgi:hypothetical protein